MGRSPRSSGSSSGRRPDPGPNRRGVGTGGAVSWPAPFVLDADGCAERHEVLVGVHHPVVLMEVLSRLVYRALSSVSLLLAGWVHPGITRSHTDSNTASSRLAQCIDPADRHPAESDTPHRYTATESASASPADGRSGNRFEQPRIP